MTAPALLFYICAAILSQVAVVIAVGVSRWRGAVRPIAVDEPEHGSPVPPGAWPGLREFRVASRTFEDAARSQCSFRLEPVDGLPLSPFRPGQFLTFVLDVPGDPAGPAPGNRTLTRCYSLSDLPDPAAFRVTIKRASAPPGKPDVPRGVCSNHLLDHLQEGDVVAVKAPAGRFFLDPDSATPVVLIAGGIGITPMMSMLRWCLVAQPARTIHLYYGVRNGREQAFKPLLEQLAGAHPNFHLDVVYSQPEKTDVLGRDFQHVGRIDIELLRRTLPQGPRQFYVCGPAAMMESLIPALRTWGVPEQDIFREAFGPASGRPFAGVSGEQVPTDALSIEVKFRRSARTLIWDGRDASLLDFAERHSVAVEAGCRSGSCGTCDTKLVSGTIRYAHAPDYQLAPGHCLPCIGVPATPLVLDA